MQRRISVLIINIGIVKVINESKINTMEKQTKAIDGLKKRVGLTKKQVAKMIIKADDKNTDHLKRVRKLTDNLEEMKNKFKGLITDYSPKGPVDLDEVKKKLVLKIEMIVIG